MILAEYQIKNIREVMSQFDPASSSSASSPLPVAEIYIPSTHMDVFDIDRVLVVGNRGTGKSVLSGLLADKSTRESLSLQKKISDLDSVDVELGFHQHAAQKNGVAPSGRRLTAMLKQGRDPESIWIAVLILATSKYTKAKVQQELEDLVDWVENNPAKAEALLRKSDDFFSKKGRKFLLVFDALDRMGRSWDEIRPLTRGLLTLALSMVGYNSLRAKVFMRTDQFKDSAVFSFPDASKLQAGRVDIKWDAVDLYGLFFQLLRNNTLSAAAFEKLYKELFGKRLAAYNKILDSEGQRLIFNHIAGEYMGSDHRRGRTYTWLIDHLADAFQETTPRSFLVALRRAASTRQQPSETPIDHHGIREGVQEASQVRVAQLSEDYPWISDVLKDLSGLEVPCLPQNFIRRWQDCNTAKSIRARNDDLPEPVGFEKDVVDEESALLESLYNIGVIEFRSENKINMPDIFRVAAKIKRRGGVRTPMLAKAGV